MKRLSVGFWILILPLVGGLALTFLIAPPDLRPWWMVAGIVIVLPSFGLAVWAILTMQAAGVDPAGTSNRVVQSGPYRFSRNPSYLGVIGMAFGVAVFTRSPFVVGSTAISWCLYNWFLIPREETFLGTYLGPEFHAYAARVRRWL